MKPRRGSNPKGRRLVRIAGPDSFPSAQGQKGHLPGQLFAAVNAHDAASLATMSARLKSKSMVRFIVASSSGLFPRAPR